MSDMLSQKMYKKWTFKSKYLQSHPLFQTKSNRDLLQKRSTEAEKLRKNILKGANILLIGGATFHDTFYIDIMNTSEINIYVMDRMESHWPASCASGQIAGFTLCDMSDNEGLEHRAKQALLQNDFHSDFFNAVICHDDDLLHAAARVAVALNMSMNDPASYWHVGNKSRMREGLRTAGLPVPKFMVLNQSSEVKEACEYVGLPAIVKLSNGKHSVGVYKVHNVDEATKAFLSCRSISRKEYIADRSEGVLIEEYLQGIEVDVDVMLSCGECTYAKVMDNWCQPPFFQDLGVHAPSACDDLMQSQLIKLVLDALAEFGFQGGTFHCEAKYTKNGPQILEINARAGCGPMLHVHRKVWGVNLLEQHLFAAIGMPVRPISQKSALGFCSVVALNAPYSGTVNCDDWLEELKQDALVSEAKYWVKKGDQVIGPETDVPTIIGEVACFSTVSREEANSKAISVSQSLAVPITPEGDLRKPFYIPGKIFPFVNYTFAS